MRRIMGFFIFLAAIVGVAISVGIAIYGQRAVDQVGAEVTQILTLTATTLDTVDDSLVLATTAVNDVNNTLVTVEESADNLAITITQTGPLIDQIGNIASNEVPNTLDAVQETLPNIITVAGTVDNTLTTLSRFGFDQDFGTLDLGPLGEVPLGAINFDLGIEYDPEVRFDDSIRELGASIEGLPAQMRTLETFINVTNDNLTTISQDVTKISEDIETLNGTLSETPVLLEEYRGTVVDVQDNLRQTRAQIERQLETAKLVVLGLAIWFGLMQLAPLYLGWELMSGGRMVDNSEQVVVVEEDPIPIVHEDN